MSTTASRIYNFVDDKNSGVPITASRMDAEFDNIITKLNQKVLIKSSAPTSPIAGMLWFDSTNNLLKAYVASAWVTYLSHSLGSKGYIEAFADANSFTTIPPGTTGYPLLSRGLSSIPIYDLLTSTGIATNQIDTQYLKNGSASPGNEKYYGTDSNGTKGFHSVSQARSAFYTSSGSFLVPNEVRTILITLCGAGGGGQASRGNPEGGDGAGGGAVVFRYAYSVDVGSTYSFVVGTGGQGGTGPSGHGGSGGSSSFNSGAINANGGGGSGTRTGGTATTFAIDAVGQTAGVKKAESYAGGNGAEDAPPAGGGGGGSYFGAGGTGGASDANGSPGTGFGGGGGGAGTNTGAGWKNGGAGADGCIYIEW